MPQLDFSTFFSQAFWLVVSFLLLWLIMAWLIVPKIADILNRRERKIDDFLSAAANFKQSAEEAIKKYEQAMQKANAEAAETTRKANAELERKIAEREQENNRRLEEALAENERRIEENRQQTMTQIEATAAGLALLIADKLNLGGVVTAADLEQKEQNNE